MFALWGCAGETTRQAETCAIYQAFYEYWPVSARTQLRLVRQARPHTTKGLSPVNRISPGLLADPHNLHPPEFVEDTSAYFGQLSSDATMICDCFPEEGPTFINESERHDL